MTCYVSVEELKKICNDNIPNAIQVKTIFCMMLTHELCVFCLSHTRMSAFSDIIVCFAIF